MLKQWRLNSGNRKHKASEAVDLEIERNVVEEQFVLGTSHGDCPGHPQTDTSSGLVELQQLLKLQELPRKTGAYCD